jgi:hypothetical protein
VRNKLKLTEQLVAQLPAQFTTTVEVARTSWWFNIRPGGGLRLTALGYKVLSEHLELKFYPYKIPDEMLFTQQTILDLDRKLQNPYYVVTKKSFPVDIVFFSSKEAMLLNLYGNLEKFLDNYQ